METLKWLVTTAAKGGFFMIPLLVVAAAALAVVVERLLYLRENRIDWDRFQFELRSALRENHLDKAVVLAAKTRGLVGRVMQEALLRVQAGETDLDRATEKVILAEMGAMEKSRGWLATLIQVAPMLGLIGTVQGMIMVFMTIERTASADPRVLGGGIYTKLITTFTGLIIAVPASLAQEHIRKRSNDILHHLELYLLEVKDWVRQREGRRAAAAEASLPVLEPAESPIELAPSPAPPLNAHTEPGSNALRPPGKRLGRLDKAGTAGRAASGEEVHA